MVYKTLDRICKSIKIVENQKKILLGYIKFYTL